MRVLEEGGGNEGKQNYTLYLLIYIYMCVCCVLSPRHFPPSLMKRNSSVAVRGRADGIREIELFFSPFFRNVFMFKVYVI